ncbi:MAG TPA: ABC transporter permease [Firmicutes bacterium]|nr:ABC transporter permease [Bacillota bacterium]
MIISEGVKSAVTLYRLNTMGLNPDQVQQAIAPVMLQNRALTGEEGSLYDFLIPFIFGIILMFSAMFSGQVLMYGVIKEKRNRIVEILLSSISSLDLLLGKIIGFGALGLLQIVIWITVGLIVAKRFLDLEQLSLSFADLITPLLFFFGGYLLFSSLYAALGATMKDAEGGSQMQGMVILVPMVPLFASSAILMAPNAFWVRLFSFLPPFIPVTMLIRVSATTLPWWEVAASFVMLIISVAFVIYLGARIFSRGILQFERTLSLKEIGKMLKKGY